MTGCASPDAAPSDAAMPGSTNDKFGIKQIYPTRVGGDSWFINMTNPDDDLGRFDPRTNLKPNSDGSWKLTSTQVRMNVFTKEGYQGALITTYDQDELAAKGFMQSANDWKNVEMTGYIKLNSAPTDDNFSWYARGGYHGVDAGDGGTGCEGTSYKAGLFFSGQTRLSKEQWHASGYTFTNFKPAQAGPLQGRWVGFKAAIYNVDQDRGVKVELFADWAANNTWENIDEMLDTTGFGDEGGRCDGARIDLPVLWGGPIATFRWDSATDVDIKNLSVREIQPPSTF